MCELLINIQDKKVWTTTEWRNWLNTRGLPEAQTWLVNNPYTQLDYDTAIFNSDIWQSYIYAKRMMISGKSLTPEQIAECEAIIFAYESNPLTDAQKAIALFLLKDQTDKIPSRYVLFQHYRNLIDVESNRTDENKQAELTIKDRGLYKPGMIVDIFENGVMDTNNHVSKQRWIAEGNSAASWPSQGKLVIVKLPLVLADKARGLLEHQEEDDLGNLLVDAYGRPVMFRRRRWSLLFNSVPAAIRNTLIADGEITVTVSQIRNYLKRIRDNAQFVGLD